MSSLRVLVLRRSFLLRASLIELTFGVIVVLGLLEILDSLTKLIAFPLVRATASIFPFALDIQKPVYEILVFFFRASVFYLLVVLPLRRTLSRVPEQSESKPYSPNL